MGALLSVSFGTSYVDTREKTIDAVDALLAQAFADRAFYSAWTSGKIIARVKEERGEHHDTLDEAFERLSADGVEDLLVATMCLMNGHEMHKIEDYARRWASEDERRVVRIAAPLMGSDEDRVALAHAVCEEFSSIPQDEALVLMGHGSPYSSNEVYHRIQDALVAEGRPSFIIATVEGDPTFEDALAVLRQRAVTRVHLAPFMFVAGEHATNDMAGDEGDSWMNQLKAEGYEVMVTFKGLGQYELVRQLVVQHAREAL